MNPTITHVQGIARLWPAMLMFAVLLLLPFQRYAGLPVLIMSVIGLLLLVRRWRELWAMPAMGLLTMLWLGYALPMLVASFDAIEVGKSWATTVASLRFLLMGVFALHYLARPEQRRWLWRWSAWLVLAWTLDAAVQAVLGFDLLGIPHSDDRLNGIFGENIKLGPVLAAVSPILLEYARRHWRRGALIVVYALLMSVIVMVGTRAAWVMFAGVTLCYLYLYARHHPRRWLKSLTLLGLLVAVVGFAAYQFSPTLQQRIDRSMLLLEGDADAVNQALSRRLPIWSTAWAMILDHPVNGVGPRGFRHAYADYAAADDPWVNPTTGTGASHGHQLFLEVASETGVIGLAGLFYCLLMAWRSWSSWDWDARNRALPWAICLAAMLFPVNTHLAFYSTFWSLLFWWLVILYCGSATADPDYASNPESGA